MSSKTKACCTSKVSAVRWKTIEGDSRDWGKVKAFPSNRVEEVFGKTRGGCARNKKGKGRIVQLIVSLK